MSKKELEQANIFQKLSHKEITQAMVAKMLRLSNRQIRRKWKRFFSEGAAGLVHKNRGRSSPKVWQGAEKEKAMHMLQDKWEGFGPTFAAEQLEEQFGIKVSRETLRKEMIKQGLWQPKKRRSKHRKRRDRKEYFGEFIQLDGSLHDWFEGRAPRCTLLVFIDDATSKIVWLEFTKSESTEGVSLATRHYMEKVGRPQCFYTDCGSVFKVNLNNKEENKVTQFERMLEELNIEISRAHSPQAKGRVERCNQTLQDRLIKFMKMHNISTIKQANEFVQRIYIEQHNRKFAVLAAKKGDLHRPVGGIDLDNIFCLKDIRILQNDFTLLYKKRILQLSSQQKAVIYPKNEITIHEQFDGSLACFIRGIPLNFTEIDQRKRRQIKKKETIADTHCKPRKDHPWRKGYKNIPAVYNHRSNGGYFR